MKSNGQTKKQPINKSNSPKWYQAFWIKIISVLTVIGVIVAILSDGAQVLDRISGTSVKDTLSGDINNNTSTINNITTTNTYQAENNLLPAKVSLSLFTLNSDICHYKQLKLKDNTLKITSTLPSEVMFDFDKPPIVLMDVTRQDTIYVSNVEGNESAKENKIDTIKVNDNNRLPIFDVTVLNEGDENVILTNIKAHVYSFYMEEGDGSEGGGKSYAIQSINRYKIILPDLYQLSRNQEGTLRKEFIQDYPALPPILIAPHDAARYQIQLGNSQQSGATYILSFEFIFSNKQSIFTDKINITF